MHIFVQENFLKLKSYKLLYSISIAKFIYFFSLMSESSGYNTVLSEKPSDLEYQNILE